MKFYSPDFGDFKTMPPAFTCEGENYSPTFVIGDVPPGAQELIIICHDPDASSGHDWTHWLVTGLPVTVTEVSDKNLPPGAKVGVSSFGIAEYGGPCPPPGSGPHRYIFSLYAVDKKLAADNAGSREMILKNIAGHIAAQSTWTGTYQRVNA